VAVAAYWYEYRQTYGRTSKTGSTWAVHY